MFTFHISEKSQYSSYVFLRLTIQYYNQTLGHTPEQDALSRQENVRIDNDCLLNTKSGWWKSQDLIY